MTIRLAILGSTRGTSLQPIIDAIEAGSLDASIEIVLSNKPDAYILERAKQHNVESLCIPSKGKTREAYDEAVLNVLKKRSIDCILLIGYMRILSPAFVHAYEGKILNVHPSLLPKFPGEMDLNVHEAVIAAGETETGCTIHLVDEGVDTGKILLQKRCAILPEDTPETLKAKVQALEGEAFIDVIQSFSI